MKELELHTEHDQDIKDALAYTGCLDSQSRIRSWKGGQVMPLLDELGHTSLDFNKCRCKKSPAN
jgi:hypothetical protein